jgi:hypothetical protein
MFELIVEAINGCRNTPKNKLRLVPRMMANFTKVAATSALHQTAESRLHKLAREGRFMTRIRRLQEAGVIATYVLNDRRRVLGEEHLDTIMSMNNLALTLGDHGQLDEAAEMNMEVLEKLRRIHGEQHPDTIGAMINLAHTLEKQGQLDEAAKMKKEVLEKMRCIFDEEHPGTIAAMFNLGNTLEAVS